MADNLANNILVHTCCAPCSSYSIDKLIKDNYNPVSFFYNPNIFPKVEYERRRDELISFAEQKTYRLIIEESPYEKWLEAVKGLENEPEKGNRCKACFRFRLKKTAIYAKENNFDAFTTVLTISPHKDALTINQIGRELQEKYNIRFLEENFKKNDGFKKSLEISKEYRLYRQSYCGCEFSK